MVTAKKTHITFRSNPRSLPTLHSKTLDPDLTSPSMADEKKSKHRYRSIVFESMYPVLALMLILVACVELCDAATVVDVYRLIQYDISGVPFGSRFSSLNHHAASLSFQRGADLSRSVLILPLRELDIGFVQGSLDLICG